jgi:septum site-determining protein MinC
MSAAINVKGIREGVLITLDTGDMADILARLAELVDSRRTFFSGGKVALQVQDRRLSLKDIARLRQVFEQRGVAVWAVLGTDPATRAAARKLGLETAFAPRIPVASDPPTAAIPDLASGTGVLVARTLRSGQSVCHAGHVVILGDINPGAEVIAGGDIVVWGHLRGTVHAGATGDEERCVCALDLSPTQLRIGNRIARPPEGRRRSKGVKPERAFISNGQIVAERWQ